MHRVDRPLWVAADGESVRAYRNFYARNLIETPLAFRGKSREYAGILPERPHYSFLA
jgi:hypothetical protein